MNAASSPARLLVIGRSAASRSVVASAFRTAGFDVEDIASAASLTLHTLHRVQVIVALDQHAYTRQWLRQQDLEGVHPLFLPVEYRMVEDPSSASASERFGVAQESAAPRTSDTVEQDDGLRVRTMHEAYPDIADDRDPGPLTELESPQSTSWFAIVAVLIGLVMGAYLMFGPKGAKERAADAQRHKAHAAEQAWKRAAHVGMTARRVSTTTAFDARTLAVTCRRLRQEGNDARAAQVCAKAARFDLSVLPLYASSLANSGATDQAEELLTRYLAQHPTDTTALEAAVSLYRERGDVDKERAALVRLIDALQRTDPLPALRTRWEELRASDPAADP